MDAEFATIREGLRRLYRVGGSRKVFGSESHGFDTNPPVAESVIRDFERQHRVLLPPDYRGFMLQVGNGGAGPFYGLFRLGEEDGGTSEGSRPWSENDGLVGVPQQAFPHTDPWNDLNGQPQYDESRENDPEWEDEYEQQMDEWEQVYFSATNMNGAIPICHLGCALRQWLVVTGLESGNVWDDMRADYRGLRPLQQGGRERVTFMQWYCDWLDDALRKLA